jgi:hypothetical protein
VDQVVDLDDVVGAPLGGRGVEFGLQAAEALDVLGGGDGGRPGGQLARDVGLHEEQILDVGRRQRRDEEPVPRSEVEEPLSAQGVQPLPHRGGAHVQVVGDLLDADELAGVQRPRHDQRADVGGDLVAQREAVTSSQPDVPGLEHGQSFPPAYIMFTIRGRC